MVALAYLHGLGSGPRSYKGTHLRRRLAPIPLLLPDLNRPSLEALSPTAGLAHMETVLPERVSLVGSSYGGWLAALFAARHPDRVERLVLLCPGFHLASRWPELVGPVGMEQWKRTGSLPLETGGNLPWSFLEESQGLQSAPRVTQRTWIVHGRQDAVVPFESSAAYAQGQEHVTLVPVDDDHGLASSLDTIEDLVRGHLII